MPRSDGLSLVVFSGGFDRVHYALSMAAAAAATGRRVSLLVSGRAVRALLPEGWRELDPADDGAPPAERDRFLTARGIASFEELLEACAALEVRIIVCEMALRALDLPAGTPLRADVPASIGGIVGFLDLAAGANPLFV